MEWLKQVYAAIYFDAEHNEEIAINMLQIRCCYFDASEN